MLDKTINIPTPDGEMETFVVHPDGPGPFPAVILYMDAPGIRNELREFCRRIAEQGYYVLLPDMYYRLGRVRFRILDAAERKLMFEAMYSLNNSLVMRDTGAILEHIATQPEASKGPMGCIGYCMSGQYVVTAAGTYPDQFAAAASLYGVGIVTDQDDSPHTLADQMSAELYLGFAERDTYVPDDVVPALRAALDKNNVTYRLDTWPDTDHGFCFPQRGTIYHESTAEQVWEIVFDLYARRLKVAP